MKHGKHSRHVYVSLFALALAAGGCSGGDDNATNASTSNSTSNAAANSTSPDMRAEVPETCEPFEQNECGGCGVLAGAPGDACGTCGTYTCAPDGRLDCTCSASTGCIKFADALECACTVGYQATDVGGCKEAEPCATNHIDVNGDLSECRPAIASVAYATTGELDHDGRGQIQTLYCNYPTTVLSGGGRWTDTIAPGAIRSTLDLSEIELDGLSWASKPGKWSISQVCGEVEPLAGLQRVTQDEEIPGDTPGCAEVACPDGSVLVGGGANFASHFEVTHLGSAAGQNKSWKVCGKTSEDHPGSVTNLQAIAHCMKLETIRTQSESIEVVAGEEDTCLQALCGDGEITVGGGVTLSGVARLRATEPHSADGAAPSGWTGCARSAEAGVMLSVEAFCIPAN